MARRRRKHYNEGEFQRGYRGQVDSFMRQLREKGEHVVQAAKSALKTGANDTAGSARSFCPVVTGKLRASIKVVELDDGAAYEIRAGAKNQDGVPYGQFVEYAPWGHPFLLPALEANSDRVRNNIKRAIQDAIRQGR